MKINVTGVPEHFNLPWKLCLEEKLFPADIEVVWRDEPSGTGAICTALRNQKADLAVCLTEGIVLDIEKGNPSTIIDIFVNSPLIWGIHISSSRTEKHIEDFVKPNYAISRFQSGSHLMAHLESKSRNKPIAPGQWKQIQTLTNAIQSLSKRETDIFFWEKFMTMRYVDNNILIRIGEFPTPWPCFVVAARTSFLNQYPKEIQTVLEIVQARAEKLQKDPDLYKLVNTRFNIAEPKAKLWSDAVEWNTKPIAPDILKQILKKVRITIV